MIFNEAFLKGCYTIELEPFTDDRGWFARTFSKDKFDKIGHSKEWLQHNHSTTYKKGSIRGMHFQFPPFAEIKLVRCIAGSIFDVAVDLRKDSPTFLKWFGVELSAENKKSIYIPEGFAHGFQTLSDNCELIYYSTAMYTPSSESGLMYNDKLVNINWKLPVSEISARDKAHAHLDKNFNGVVV